jgi:prolyl-tRNA editing enzyme YbaK/EbsC (Cys-tRNA(Pro) deacylase)
MASEDEVLLVTGYRVGAVAPIGLSQPLRILADETIFTVDEISIGSGERGLAVILKSADLVKAIGKVEIGQFAEM